MWRPPRSKTGAIYADRRPNCQAFAPLFFEDGHGLIACKGGGSSSAVPHLGPTGMLSSNSMCMQLCRDAILRTRPVSGLGRGLKRCCDQSLDVASSFGGIELWRRSIPRKPMLISGCQDDLKSEKPCLLIIAKRGRIAHNNRFQVPLNRGGNDFRIRNRFP